MKARKLCVSGWTWLGGCFFLALSVGICYHLAAAAEAQGMGLEVTMSTPRPAILRGEPLVLDIHIRNAGHSAVKIYPLNYNLNAVSLRITDPGRSRKGYRPAESVNIMKEPDVALAAGQAYSYRTVVFYGVLDRQGREGKTAYAFPFPGDYLLEATYHAEYTEASGLRAPPLKVSVQEPQGRDREALQLFRVEPIRDFLARNPCGGEAPKDFAQLAGEYADTVYGRFAQFYMLRDLSRVLATEDGERHKSLAALEGLARNAEFPLADEALLHLALCYACLERKPQAIAAWEEIARKFRNSPVAAQAAKMLEKLGKNLLAPSTEPATP